MKRCLLMIALWLGGVGEALGQVQTFRNDYPGFLNAAGGVQTIDFETLPDGTPSAGHAGTPITATFNYDAQGVHFSSPVENPYIAGNPINGFDLRVSVESPLGHTWIIADLVTPTPAVGIFFPGATVLRAYDAIGVEIAHIDFGGTGPGQFLGIVSSAVPIARAVVDRGTAVEDIGSFLLHPVPEPGSAALLAAGAAWAGRRAARARKARAVSGILA